MAQANEEFKFNVRAWIKAITEYGPRSPSSRHVLLTLTRWMSQSGYCYPSVDTIARATYLSEKTVRTSLLLAISDGWLERYQRKNKLKPRGWKLCSYQATFPHAVTVAGSQPSTCGNDFPRRAVTVTDELFHRNSSYIGAGLGADAPAHAKAFELIKKHYPQRKNGDDHNAAFSVWCELLDSGESTQNILEGVKAYKAHCQRSGHNSTYTYMLRNFLKNKKYQHDWQSPKKKKQKSVPVNFDDVDYTEDWRE